MLALSQRVVDDHEDDGIELLKAREIWRKSLRHRKRRSLYLQKLCDLRLAERNHGDEIGPVPSLTGDRRPLALC